MLHGPSFEARGLKPAPALGLTKMVTPSGWIFIFEPADAASSHANQTVFKLSWPTGLVRTLERWSKRAFASKRGGNSVEHHALRPSFNFASNASRMRGAPLKPLQFSCWCTEIIASSVL